VLLEKITENKQLSATEELKVDPQPSPPPVVEQTKEIKETEKVANKDIEDETEMVNLFSQTGVPQNMKGDETETKEEIESQASQTSQPISRVIPMIGSAIVPASGSSLVPSGATDKNALVNTGTVPEQDYMKIVDKNIPLTDANVRTFVDYYFPRKAKKETEERIQKLIPEFRKAIKYMRLMYEKAPAIEEKQRLLKQSISLAKWMPKQDSDQNIVPDSWVLTFENGPVIKVKNQFMVLGEDLFSQNSVFGNVITSNDMRLQTTDKDEQKMWQDFPHDLFKGRRKFYFNPKGLCPINRFLFSKFGLLHDNHKDLLFDQGEALKKKFCLDIHGVDLDSKDPELAAIISELKNTVKCGDHKSKPREAKGKKKKKVEEQKITLSSVVLTDVTGQDAQMIKDVSTRQLNELLEKLINKSIKVAKDFIIETRTNQASPEPENYLADERYQQVAANLKEYISGNKAVYNKVDQVFKTIGTDKAACALNAIQVNRKIYELSVTALGVDEGGKIYNFTRIPHVIYKLNPDKKDENDINVPDFIKVKTENQEINLHDIYAVAYNYEYLHSHDQTHLMMYPLWVVTLFEYKTLDSLPLFMEFVKGEIELLSSYYFLRPFTEEEKKMLPEMKFFGDIKMDDYT
jgi:hypothetical protein